MGRPKEALPLGGTTLLDRQCAAVARAACAPVVVVARDPEQALPPLPPDVEVVCDAAPGAGPLAALVTGIAHLRDRHGFGPGDAAFATGCDLPFVDAALVGWLAARLGDAEAVVPRTKARLQPLLAVYRLAVLDRAQQLLASGTRALHALADGARVRVIPEHELREFDPALRCVRDIDDPADYDEVRRDLDART